ncbi:terminase [Azospirillum melinis]|uniref:Terminase n=1 Tax=Azospirillum melinis TaxID=328839 RepID=A0ABX2KX88_9PROT|nr:terminase gpA endonuclease subunit [Azospirillum melinis]MBP2310508.1 phage terminase large subunit GpA-like protein [Azospirillum melinis]NUB04509.1 terminase [Azospirillum melinis]
MTQHLTAEAAAATVAAHEAGCYDTGREGLRDDLLGLIQNTLKFRPRMTGSEWAEGRPGQLGFGRIPKGTGSESGPVTLYGYQRGLLDAMCDPTVPLITVLKAARVGYTRMATLAIGYHLHQDPTLCAVAQPTIPDAEDFGADEIGPMLRDTPVLAEQLRPVRKGERQDKATFYRLANGASVRLVGAASDDAFRRYSARFLFGDELDAEGWTPKAKTQGDKLKLFWTRGETFWNRKQIRGGTPLLKDTSRTWKLWLQSDQRRYFVPCPHCSAAAGRLAGWQYLEWGGPDVPHGVKWSLDEDGAVAHVWYVGTCGHRIEEGHKSWMDERGEWRATAKPKQPGHVGFHLWTGMSLNPNAAWPVLVGEWIEAQADPASLVQPFVNLRLGMPYEATYGHQIKIEAFTQRMEPYPTEIPPGVAYLTAGVDVQSGKGKNPRIEVTVYGWGRGHECWLIGHWIFRGDPAQREVWDQLDRLLLRSFVGPDGRRFRIQAAAVDSGGHHTAETYAFCELRRARRVWAIKGRSEKNGQRTRVWPRRPTVKNGNTVYLVGGNAARDFVYGSLAVPRPGPRYIHFPSDAPAEAEPLDTEFFEQLTRERLITPKGGQYTVWDKPKDKAHEAGVCLVYAYAAAVGLQTLNKKWLTALEGGPAALPQALPAVAEAEEDTDPAAALPLVEEPPAPAPAAVIKSKRPRGRRVIRSNL